MLGVIDLITSQWDFFAGLLLNHFKISAISVLMASILGIAIGILISEHDRFASFVLGIVNIVYTIPAIALLGVLISFTGIGDTTAIIALTVYGLLPMVRNTYTGIKNIDPGIVEAAEAMGSTKSQILYKIKLPLAISVLMSGLRNMVTMTIALAGIASFVGAGGLGVAIYRGISTNSATMILAGSILVALLALICDFLLGLVEKYLIKHRRFSKRIKIVFVSIVCILLAVFGIFAYAKKTNTVHIASKPVTEGYIMGEILSLLVQENTDLDVELTQGVGGGTANIHPGMEKGDFDMYTEYTGTAWQIVLKNENPYDESMFNKLQSQYNKKYDMSWVGMYGFNNSYSIAIRKDLAEKYKIKTYSDLAKHSSEFIFGAEYDFFEREDGFKAISKAYDFKFKSEKDMDNGLKYEAIKKKEIDAMTVFTTDGQLTDPNIVVLKDDKKFYPSYKAGTLIRNETLRKHPELKRVLKKLEGKISEEKMAQMNNDVETNKKKPRDVARKFLKEAGLLEVKK